MTVERRNSLLETGWRRLLSGTYASAAWIESMST
jgi:hypothetical protein